MKTRHGDVRRISGAFLSFLPRTPNTHRPHLHHLSTRTVSPRPPGGTSIGLVASEPWGARLNQENKTPGVRLVVLDIHWNSGPFGAGMPRPCS